MNKNLSDLVYFIRVVEGITLNVYVLFKWTSKGVKWNK